MIPINFFLNFRSVRVIHIEIKIFREFVFDTFFTGETTPRKQGRKTKISVNATLLTTYRVQDVAMVGMAIGRRTGDFFAVDSKNREVYQFTLSDDNRLIVIDVFTLFFFCELYLLYVYNNRNRHLYLTCLIRVIEPNP